MKDGHKNETETMMVDVLIKIYHYELDGGDTCL